jgi:hypothetical protein
MPSFLRRLFDRLSDKVNRSAAGTPVPAGVELPVPGERPKPTAHERTLIRRRLRTVTRRRESGEGPATLEQLDAEAQSLRTALDELKTLDELIAAGVVQSCPGCGELVGAHDGGCTSCGSAQKAGSAGSTSDDGGPATQQLPAARVGDAHPAA